MKRRLVQRLFDGPVDIIGDVHGESGALFQLLDRLGYDGNGHHKQGRRLVFLGDLVDRGPDSIAVVKFVMRLVSRGIAQCILGNHELNLLLGEHKHGNHWFYGETEALVRGSTEISFQNMIDPSDHDLRNSFLDFFRTLPVVLERPDLRVVHAMWHDEAVDALRTFDGDVLQAFDFFSEQSVKLQNDLTDPIDIELVIQNGNPVKVCTSGREVRADKEFYAGGKMRQCDRDQWWRNYKAPVPVVVGHYWRKRGSTTPDDLFARAAGSHGMINNVICIDYSVGKRFEERATGVREGSTGTSLGALRVPENVFLFEDGSSEPVSSILV